MADVLELLALIAVNLVDRPQDVRIQRLDQHGVEVYRVGVHADDLGKFIGKGGQTARATRCFLQAVGARLDRRVALEIVE